MRHQSALPASKLSVCLLIAALWSALPLLAFQVDVQRGLARSELPGGKVEIDYGRPPHNGRDLLAMMPAGQVWRMGMNAATTLQTEVPLQVGDKRLEAGSYVLTARRADQDSWELQIRDTSNAVLAQAPLNVHRDSEAVDLLTIELEPAKADRQPPAITLRVKWGSLRGQSQLALAP